YLNGECTLNVCTCPAGSSCFVYPCLSLTCGPNATCTGGLGAGWACNTCYAGDGVTCAPAVPGTSGSVTATAGYQQVALSWAAVPCATTYNLYRSVGGGSFSLVQSSVSGTALTDTGLTNGTNYGYVVRAVNAAGEGTGSSAVYATPFAPTATRTWAYNGDTNGALYWLGSARGLGSWANPLRTGYATGSNSATITGCSTLSSTTSCDTGWTSNRNVGTTVNPANASDIPVSTTSTTTAFVRHDLGADHTLVLNRYALRSRCDAASHYPRNWLLQGSNDGSNWTTLRPHAFEGTLLARCRWSSWAISSSIGYRCFRIARDGTLSFSGSSPTGAVIFDEVEFYGTVTYVPATPTGVMATGISQGVTVQWNAVTRALSYNLFVSTDGVTFSLQASGITATSTSATGLTPGGQRFFRVQASNLGGVSAQGATVTAAAL
ncbi:MAG: fibronectin type III domain-containing protein, partial [Deltaproteobacteria bacterium]|nr:fibronectin type III domain-containing protein [Deltaproteobacteria bacterium]